MFPSFMDHYHLVNSHSYGKMVRRKSLDLPLNSMVIFHNKLLVYQRLNIIIIPLLDPL